MKYFSTFALEKLSKFQGCNTISVNIYCKLQDAQLFFMMNKFLKKIILFIVVNKNLLFLHTNNIVIWNLFQDPTTTQE